MSSNAFIDSDLANFGHLLYRVRDKKEQDKYVNRWNQHYVNLIKSSGPEELFKWNIRVHKSLKEVFTSVAFYQESLIAKESKSWSAFFFLSYYSLFHSLLSCVVLMPSESIEKLSQITHTKLIKIFKSTFCDQAPNIIRGDVDELFFLLKYMREYYSYNMPPNDFLYEQKENIKPDRAIPYFIRSCSQLASLHSEIIEAANSQHHKEITNMYQYQNDVEKRYMMLNCPKHPKTEEYILHYSDKVRMREALEYPQPISFLTEFEHFVDEFRNYEGAESPKFSDGREIDPGAFVYNAIYR